MISIAKTKVCKPDRRVGFYTLNYTTGIDVIADTVETAIKYGIIQQGGAWFTFVDIDTGETMLDEEGEILKVQGKANLIQLLKNTPELLQQIRNNLQIIIERD